MKKRILVTSGIFAGLLALCAVFMVVGYFKYMAIDAVEYDLQLEILLGGGGNSVILTSEDGTQALVVDTKMGSAAKAMRKKVKAKEVFVVNTHLHADHTGGNPLYPEAKFISGACTKDEWVKSGTKGRYPDETVAEGADRVVRIGTEIVHIRNIGRAHTASDCIVYLEKRKMLITGDLVSVAMHPVLNAKNGCNVGSWISALGVLSGSYDVKALVPGHGPVSDRSAIDSMTDYFVSIRDCAGDRRKLAAKAEKYRKYYGMPGMSSFDKTIKFIENEKRK